MLRLDRCTGLLMHRGRIMLARPTRVERAGTPGRASPDDKYLDLIQNIPPRGAEL
jgi:hypothetical protein